MHIFKKIMYFTIFFVLTIFLMIYLYAFLNPLTIHDGKDTITIYDSEGSILYESTKKKNMEWVNIDEIPTFIQDAVVSVEDKRFFMHVGFDPIRIVKALGTNVLQGGIVEGGSTITQQYAKNLFLTNEQTVSRKIDEFFYATRLEMQYSKQEILEGYLNTVYFGHGIYGIKNAASFFFDKELAELSISEVAMLIGIPNGPSYFSPFINLEGAKNRQAIILQVLKNGDVIDEAQYANASNEELLLAKNDEKKQEVGNDEYFIDSVLQELQHNMNISTNQELHVYTSYDPHVQNILQSSINNYMKDDELECASVVVQPFSGNVLAIAGGKDYTLSQYNRALYSQRQVASTIKPLLYYAALSQGFTPSSPFISQRTTFPLENGEEYAPQNYSNSYPNKEISMINAIAMSDNIYAVKTHLFLGTKALHQALYDFDITQAQENPSEALGTVNMSVLELSRIYNTFASEGIYKKPSFIQKITNKDTILYEQDTSVKRLLNRDTTLVLNQMLTAPYDAMNATTQYNGTSSAIHYPTMYGFTPPTTVGVKSGTSDWDSWVVGFNPEYTLVFWTGFDDNRILESDYYEVAKQMFKQTLDGLYPDTSGPWYQPSDAIEIRYVDPISGEAKTNGHPYWYMKEN